MRFVRPGKTNMEVSAITFGTWSFGGEWGAFDEDEAKGAIHRALDLGVTFFDTAQRYDIGKSESCGRPRSSSPKRTAPRSIESCRAPRP